MDHLQEIFYFIQFDDAIRGPYPLRTILDYFCDGKINVYTRCSADKQNWENLSDILLRHGVEYATVERTLTMKKATIPPPPRIVCPKPAVPAAAPMAEATAVSAPTPWLNAVFGMLWHPAVQIAKVAERPGRALAVTLMYQFLFTLLVTAGRGVWILHRPDWWKRLWFAPVEMLAVLMIAFVAAGIALLPGRFQISRDDHALAVIGGNGMICGTWTAVLFALAPGQFPPWRWFEWLTVIFLSSSFLWFTVMAAELMTQWMTEKQRSHRYWAILLAVLMMLSATAIVFYLILLYREF